MAGRGHQPTPARYSQSSNWRDIVITQLRVESQVTMASELQGEMGGYCSHSNPRPPQLGSVGLGGVAKRLQALPDQLQTSVGDSSGLGLLPPKSTEVSCTGSYTREIRERAPGL